MLWLSANTLNGQAMAILTRLLALLSDLRIPLPFSSSDPRAQPIGWRRSEVPGLVQD